MADENVKAPEASAPAPQSERPSGGPGGPGSGPGGRPGGRPVDPVDPADAASFSAARRFASSAPRRLMPSPIGMFVCCRDSWLSVARLCPAASPAFAPRTSAA